MTLAETMIDHGLLTDELIRKGIRRQLKARLRREAARHPKDLLRRRAEYATWLRTQPIADQTDAANEQHYQVPSAFFAAVLGPYAKYSCGLWPDAPDEGTLAQAEDAMLALTAKRAGVRDGMDILDLGCGWGSLSIWLAEHFPACQIVAVSNSATQRAFIVTRCAARGITNVEVRTGDVNHFDPGQQFDRVISIEMFEHVRNYAWLLERVASWLRPEGKLFTHVFAHKQFPYAFESGPDDSWMGRMFFSGGQMPSEHLFFEFQDHMKIDTHWRVNGTHYARTARAWLDRLDAQRAELIDVLSDGDEEARGSHQLRRWRVFFMACEELWAFAKGDEWFVVHNLWTPSPHLVDRG